MTEHLSEHQWKPGESGNPNGRPKGSKNIKTLIEQVWNEEVTDANGNGTIQGLLAIKAMLDKAQDGDVQAFKALCERLEGQPKQEIDFNAQVVKMDKIKLNGKDVDFDVGDTQITELTSETAEDS